MDDVPSILDGCCVAKLENRLAFAQDQAHIRWHGRTGGQK